jgi:uncharacterized SAM-binding protein YcdF (DUF218 family)
MAGNRGKSVFSRLVGLLLLLAAAWAWKGASWLIVDQPQKADAIVVLAGETEERPRRGLELLQQGFGSHLYLDTPSAMRLYRMSQIDLAEQYLRAQPNAAQLSVCPIAGLSTRDETGDVAKCLNGTSVHSVLLVTSEFHTRRALSIFRHQLPQIEVHVAAAYGPSQFGVHWWQQRQWAKTFLIESLSWFWWNLVDRWR